MNTPSLANSSAVFPSQSIPTDPKNFATVCGWCPELNILKLQRRESDVVIVFQHGKELRIIRNGTVLAISHGICPGCKAKNFPVPLEHNAKR